MALGESFTTVLAAARIGAEWAWVAIYRDLAPSVMGYLKARRVPEPDDLASEVFLQVVRDLGSFEGDERDFRAWVFTIAHRRLLDDHRRRARRPVAAAGDELLDSHPAPGGAEEEALRRLSEERVRRTIGRLSPDQQSVLLLRILGDLTVDQVARVLGKPSGAVKALQRRGLAAVERELSAEAVPP